MATTREDKNTFVLIFVILVVCIIAIIAILGGIWRLIKEPVSSLGNELTQFIKRNQTYDYNFTIPQSANGYNPQPVVNNTEPQQTIPTKTENNSLKTFDNVVLTADELKKLDNGEQVSIPNIQISIDKIKIVSPVLQGNKSDEILKSGFWLAPISNQFGKGEVLLFCHRTFFGEFDQKSCWNIDKLSAGDNINISVNSEKAIYRVENISILPADDQTIYQLNSSKDSIKIITFTPRESGVQRIVITANRIG